MKKLKILAALLVLITTYSACKKALDINEDPNYQTDTGAKFLLPSGIAFSASRIGGDYQLIGSLWAQQYAQHNNSSQYRTTDNYNLTNASYNAAWDNMWAGALKDLRLAMAKAEAAGEWHYYIAAEVMSAFDYHILNDFYGAIPISEGLNYQTVPQPAFIENKAANGIIISMLDDAISKESQAAALSPMGGEDFVFEGSIENWIRFAKSLKLKILMRDFEVNRVAIQALLNENDLLTVDAKVDIFIDAENKSNPLFEQDRRKLNTAQNLRASNTLLSYLLENDDPRVAAFYETTSYEPEDEADEEWPLYFGLEQGYYNTPERYENSQTSRAIIEPTDPVFFMSAAEVAFLKAEANARLGNSTSAKTNYDQGVTLAFQRWNSADLPLNAAAFISPGGEYAFNTAAGTEGMIQQIITQKWIASTRSQSWDAFFDQNRTGYPPISTVTSNDPAYVPGSFTISRTSVLPAEQTPRRLLFPKSSSDYNPNTPTVVPIYTKMWWHK
ncbi:SusD/RagB family nutrient-binding outer membrane lipoprotein [Desertivirga xinjiangensis]|uniref:SusD/RagB family nutrient-binding outer membrane lipoprotein n=1 Tax=Desertivirga xinjiangensis TaxID=539206 RepID=UPI00210C792A|nr:SusD/RagB family nutrient-binding outer membrane lipoprotein [Pedobacter xinjiangensis]